MSQYLLFGICELIATIVAVWMAHFLTRTKRYQMKQWVTDVLTTIFLVLAYGGVFWLWSNLSGISTER